jgi:hypothetical protein
MAVRVEAGVQLLHWFLLEAMVYNRQVHLVVMVMMVVEMLGFLVNLIQQVAVAEQELLVEMLMMGFIQVMGVMG